MKNNILWEMYAEVRFDRPIDKDRHYISPGGYEMTFAGKPVPFDFMDYEGNVKEDDPAVLCFNDFRPDTSSFPEADTLTEEVVRQFDGIKEFFVYTGEVDEPEINPVKIERLEFWFANGRSIDCSDMPFVKDYRF